jgi:hypothetical protein
MWRRSCALRERRERSADRAGGSFAVGELGQAVFDCGDAATMLKREAENYRAIARRRFSRTARLDGAEEDFGDAAIIEASDAGDISQTIVIELNEFVPSPIGQSPPFPAHNPNSPDFRRS